jgi:hypothetical protein
MGKKKRDKRMANLEESGRGRRYREQSNRIARQNTRAGIRKYRQVNKLAAFFAAIS